MREGVMENKQILAHLWNLIDNYVQLKPGFEQSLSENSA
jgi:hypothetical protein